MRSRTLFPAQCPGCAMNMKITGKKTKQKNGQFAVKHDTRFSEHVGKKSRWPQVMCVQRNIKWTFFFVCFFFKYTSRP